MKIILTIMSLFFSSAGLVLLHAQQPYGANLGSYNGVVIYSNGSTSYASNDYNYYNGTNTGMKWQCVEFVNRYYLIRQSKNIRIAGTDAHQYYNTASQRGLFAYANNSNTPPGVDDILCFGGGLGHVAIIREVGTNYIRIAQQNGTNTSNDLNFILQMTVSNGKYNISASNLSSSLYVQGWLKSTQVSTGFVSVSQGVSISPSPVIYGNNFTTAFTLKEVQGSSITFESIVCAILKTDNTHLRDMEVKGPITISANGTYNYTSTQQWRLTDPVGNYKTVARGKVSGGNWFDFTTTGAGVNSVSFNVSQVVLSVNPSSELNFGDVAVGQSKTMSITITNTTLSTTNLTVTPSIPTNPFQILNGASLNLTPGSTYTFNIKFTPSNAQLYNQDWTFTHNATNFSNPWAIALNGRGITSALVIASIDPTSIQTKDWGQSVSYTFTVKDGNGNPVSGATVGGSDNVQLMSFETPVTNSSGVTTYTTTVPSGKANGTYDITFSAFKSGYTQSATLTRQVQVNHLTPLLVITNIDPSSIQTKDWGQSVTYTITVKDGNGNLVSGATVGGSDNVKQMSFQTSATNSNGVTTYTTTAPSNKANGTYDITFGAFKSGYTNSATLTRQIQVSHSTPSLSIPILSSPSNGATGISINSSLTWNAVTGAASYRLQVSTYSDFSTVDILDQSNIQNTSYQINLSYNTKYYWKVNASNSTSTSDWSSVWSFATITNSNTNFWQPKTSPNNSTINTLAVNSNGIIYCAIGSHIYSSADDGLTWSLLFQASSYSVTSLLLSSNNQIFAGTWGSGVFLSNDNGNSWTAKNDGLGLSAIGSIIKSENGSLFVVAKGQGIYRSTDNGNNWIQINTGLTNKNVNVLAINKNGYIFVGTEGGGIFRSIDSGNSWVPINNGLNYNSSFTSYYITSFAFTSNSDVFVADVEKVYRSTDNGNSWTLVNSGLIKSGQVIYLAVNSSDNIYAGSWGSGVYVSKNNGNNWAQTNSGLTDLNITSLIINSDDYLYVGTQNGNIFKSIQTKGTDCYTLSTNVYPSGSGSVLVNTSQNCSGSYVANSQISLTAQPNSGYTFSGWSGTGGSFSNTTSLITTFTITGNASVIANFQGLPSITVTPTSLSFGNQKINTVSDAKSYTVSGSNLTSNLIITAPDGFQISTQSKSGFGRSITLISSGGIVATTTIYVKFSPPNVQTYSGNIINTSTDASTQNVSVSGSGIQSEEGASIKPVVASNSISKGTEFWVEVKIGEPKTISDLYGISFKLSSNNSKCTYVDGSAVNGDFLGPSPLFFQRLSDNQTVEIAISKTSAPGANGSGILAKAKFTSYSDITSDQTVIFSLNDIVANNSSGNIINITPLTDSVIIKTVTLVDVWPGDCNNDGTVNGADLLPIGQYYSLGILGPNNPGTQWQAYSRQPWAIDSSTPKRIYADANGDGTISALDVLPIGLNYGKTHSVSGSIFSSISENKLEKNNLSNASLKLVGPTKVEKNKVFTIQVIIGDGVNVVDLYGLSFKISCNSATCTYVENSAREGSFLGNDILKFFQKVDNQTVDCAITRTKTPGVSGGGIIAMFDFVSTVNQTVIFSLTNVSAMDSNGNQIPLDVLPTNVIVDIQKVDEIPYKYSVSQNYPNPFNPSTTIKFSVPASLAEGIHSENPSKGGTFVLLKVYDLLGREVATLVNEEKAPGNYEVKFDGTNLASGVYFYSLHAGDYYAAKKLILVK